MPNSGRFILWIALLFCQSALATGGAHVSANDVLASARAQLQKDLHPFAAKIVATPLAEPPADITLPTGVATIVARPTGVRRIERKISVWVDLLVDGIPSRRIVVPFAVHAYVPVYVARRDMHRGEEFRLSDVESREVDLADLPSAPFRSFDHQGAWLIRRPLDAGEIVRRDHLAVHRAVMEGDSVVLRYAVSGITLETRAIARSSADIGQTVKVQPNTSSQAMFAEVEAPGLAVMTGKNQ